MKGLEFWKMHGAGNDFVLLDARGGGVDSPADLSRVVCRRRFGVGADGLIAITGTNGETMRVSYHNADGSRAEFCGNGARCAARFAFDRGFAQREMELDFGEVRVRAEVEPERVTIRLPRPRTTGEIELGPGDVPAPVVLRRIEAGVVHLVAVAREGEDLAPLAEIREAVLRECGPEDRSANLTRVIDGGGGVLNVATHERGSGETLACGSGALAAAEAAAVGRDAVIFTVLPPAGRPLEVRLGPGPDEASLAGEAVTVYRGELS